MQISTRTTAKKRLIKDWGTKPSGVDMDWDSPQSQAGGGAVVYGLLYNCSDSQRLGDVCSL